MRSPSFPVALLAALGCSACSTPSSVRHLEAQGALGPYSAAVRAGDLWFVSGKIGARGGSFGAEAESALDALEAELARAGATLADVVSANVFLTDMDLYGELNEIWARRFAEPYPARAVVAVAALPGQARVEVQAVARARR